MSCVSFISLSLALLLMSTPNLCINVHVTYFFYAISLVFLCLLWTKPFSFFFFFCAKLLSTATLCWFDNVLLLLTSPLFDTVINHVVLSHSCSTVDYIFSFATNATKKISESVVETAQTIKKSVEEGKIDGIIDKACCIAFLFCSILERSQG